MPSPRLLPSFLLAAALLTGCGGGDAFVPTEPPRTVVIGHTSPHLLGASFGAPTANPIFAKMVDGASGFVTKQNAEAITVDQLLTGFAPNSEVTNNLNWLAPGPSNNYLGYGGPDTVLSQLGNGDQYLSQLEITRATFQCTNGFIGTPQLSVDLNVFQTSSVAPPRKLVLTLEMSTTNYQCGVGILQR